MRLESADYEVTAVPDEEEALGVFKDKASTFASSI